MVTLAEVKDGWPHYSRRDRLLGLDSPASCLTVCPYSRVTVHPVRKCHQLADAPFFLPLLHCLLPTLKAYNIVLTPGSQTQMKNLKFGCNPGAA
jgi:hypothetical protein